VALTLGALQGLIPGVVRDDGHLAIDGSTFNGSVPGVSFTVTISGWDTSLTSPTAMVGRWTQSLAATGAPGGSAQMDNEIVTMNRTAE
jgi:hypothetical protein